MKQTYKTEDKPYMLSDTFTGRPFGHDREDLPGRQVIRNILAYAQALEVLKKKSGEPIFLIGN